MVFIVELSRTMIRLCIRKRGLSLRTSHPAKVLRHQRCWRRVDRLIKNAPGRRIRHRKYSERLAVNVRSRNVIGHHLPRKRSGQPRGTHPSNQLGRSAPCPAAISRGDIADPQQAASAAIRNGIEIIRQSQMCAASGRSRVNTESRDKMIYRAGSGIDRHTRRGRPCYSIARCT